MRMAGRAAAVAAVAMVLLSVPIQATASSYRCFHVYAPYQSYATSGGCRSGYVRAALPAGTVQLVTVTNWRQTRTYALVNAFSLAGGSWTHKWGPWTARIGAGGFADLGQKIEGDALTPQGSYGFQFMFGVNANPGVHFPWRHAYRYDYWDDDPASPRYNEWVDSRRASPGAGPEPMDVSAYYDGVVIGYNTARTPGRGSAIFLHLNIGIATAGCVTLPPGELLPLLRWLNPARSPRIRMGVREDTPGRSRL